MLSSSPFVASGGGNTSAGPNEKLSLEAVALSCASGTCQTVYRTNRGTFVVQGYQLSSVEAGVNLPEGEMLVEIPAELLSQAPHFDVPIEAD